MSVSKEKKVFLESLSLLIRARMPVAEAIASLEQEVKTRTMKRIIRTIREDVEAGSRLSDAFEQRKLLSKRYLSLLRIGEETGSLNEQLALIIADQEKETAFQQKIMQSLLYPGFVMIVTFLAGIVMLWFVFPQLTTIFVSIGGELPWTTRVIVSLGVFFRAYGIIFIPLLTIALFVVLFFLFMYSKTKKAGEHLLLMLPISHTIICQIETARFGYLLGILLKAGVPLPQALSSLEESSTFSLYKKWYAEVRERVLEGNSLYKSISYNKKSKRFLSPHVVELIHAGELSGYLSDTLLTVSAAYEEKTDAFTKNIGAILEPASILGVGLVVGVIVFSIITPIYNLIGNFGTV